MEDEEFRGSAELGKDMDRRRDLPTFESGMAESIPESTSGIGIFIDCHGLITQEIPRPIPEGIIFMKKNLTGCGDVSYPPTRHPYITQKIIVERLQHSLDIAFSAEECAFYPWDEKDRDGDPIRKETFTCPEFNTTSENQVKSFLYKTYDIKDLPGGGIFVAYENVIVNLFTVDFKNFIRNFKIPYPGLSPRPNPTILMKIQEIIDISNKIKGYIAFRDHHTYITSDFIIDTVFLLHLVHGVKIVRCLDESCNTTTGPILKTSDIGHGGKKSKRRKRKHRKSKKLRK